ncbi:winged helix DNA-binding domain-containing protein [Niveispirillum sp. KHB5.9]|uniref:winged helix DNA-binding domain-containing protein n=1 Tax=Niveispirillum sp. KHB5.9 TaxID=3400269 RepID=UPI003A88BD9F
MTEITLPQALAFRLDRQHLTRPAETALTAARTLVGAQAQVHSAAILQLRARSAAGGGEADIDRALYQDRNLVKLWAQRSTLHLTPADDLPLVMAVRRQQVGAYHNWYAKEGLSREQVEILVAAVVTALDQGAHSRMDLSRRLVPTLGEWARPMLEHSWGGIIKLACALGHVCHGPAEKEDGEGAREALFVSLAQWLGQPLTVLDSGAAMAELLRRYLAVYGPATPRDFNKFIGGYAGPAHQAFADLGDEIVPVKLAGKTAYILARDLDAVKGAAPEPGQITVLGLFDPYLLAHSDTSQYLDDRFRPAVYRVAGWISPVILRQGRVVATWTHRRVAGPKGKGAWEVQVSPLEKLFKKELPAITRGLRRLSGGVPVTISGI